MVRESLKILLAGCLLFLFLASCSPGGGRNRKLPKSTGQPYEVVLKGDTDSIVTKILTEEVPALPQPEPLCRLIQVKKGKIHDSYLLVRTRIVVNIPAAEFSVRLSRNENASPQTVIRISARSLQQLREKLNPEKLRQLVDETELEHLASIISTNPSKQNRAVSYTHLDVYKRQAASSASLDAFSLAMMAFIFSSETPHSCSSERAFSSVSFRKSSSRGVMMSPLISSAPGETTNWASPSAK